MSYIFTKCVCPPEHNNLEILLNKYSNNDVKGQFQALVESVQPHFNVPKDVWSLILRETIQILSRPEPDTWNNDYVKWFQHWNYSPELRTLNPLHVVHCSTTNEPSFGLQNNIPYQTAELSPVSTIANQWFNVEGRNVKPQQKKTTINRRGDIFYGLVINPDHIRCIESIKYEIGGQLLPMAFDLTNPIKQEIVDGTSLSKYNVDLYQAKYLPFVPLIALVYHQVKILVFFKENTTEEIMNTICINIQGIWCYLSLNERRQVAQQSHEMYPPVPMVESRWVPGKMIPDPDMMKYQYVLRIMSGMAGMAHSGNRDENEDIPLSEEQKKYFHHPELVPWAPRPPQVDIGVGDGGINLANIMNQVVLY